MRSSSSVLADLRAVVGDDHVLTDPDVTAGHARDWTGRYVGSTPAVVRPADTAEVAAVVAVCRRHRIALVPQGGNTGMVGGGVPLAGEVVVSTARLDDVGPVDPLSLQLTAGAGATIAGVAAAGRHLGLTFGVDLGSRDVATVGGAIATNAGGLRLLRHGPMRDQVVGVEAVLGDGSVISHLDGHVKDNTGYDLRGLLCGSEGTLGIVTRARLRLVARPERAAAALLALSSLDAAVVAAAWLRRSVASLAALELMTDDGVALVAEHLGLAVPFGRSRPAYLVAEAAGAGDPIEELAAAAERIEGVIDVGVADDEPGRRRLWRYREGHTEAINAAGIPRKLDLSLPPERYAAFARDIVEVVRAAHPSATVVRYGHIGDWSLHVNVLGTEHDDDVDELVFATCAAHGGSISAEHGVGAMKRPHLHLNRSPAELAAMARVKAALDPDGVLNPRAVLA